MAKENQRGVLERMARLEERFCALAKTIEARKELDEKKVDACLSMIQKIDEKQDVLAGRQNQQAQVITKVRANQRWMHGIFITLWGAVTAYFQAMLGGK